MSLRDELEVEKRRAAIRKILDEQRSSSIDQTAEPKAESKAEPSPRTAPAVAPAPAVTRPLLYPLKPWERMVAGRVTQYRPMTQDEMEAEQERHFMKSCERDQKVFEAKCRQAAKEEAAFAKETKERAAKEARTGKRPYEPGRYISLEEAQRRGLINDVRVTEADPRGRPETGLKGWNNRVDPTRFGA